MRTGRVVRRGKRWLRARRSAWRAARFRWTIRKPIWAASIKTRMQGKRTVHMLHVGKTGGTALKYVLRRNRATPAYAVAPHQHKVRLGDVPPWDDFFVFLRDPIDRYVSGFNSRLREGRPRYVKPWTKAERWAFARFTTAEELALALSSDDAVRRREAERAMRSIRHVRTGFTNWVGDGRRLHRRRRRLVLVGRLETIDADFERLKTLLSLPPEVTLPQADKAAHRDPGAAPRNLSDQARANIAQWYRTDYRLLDELCRMDGGRQDAVPRPAERVSPT